MFDSLTATRKLHEMRIDALVISILLFLVFSIAYIALSPSLQPPDGLGYSYYAEKAGLSGIIQGNHPLGNMLLNLMFVLAKQLGYSGRALPLFKVVSSIAGGITVTVFFLVSALVLKNGLSSSLGLAILLGASYSFWHYAGTAEIYNLAALFLLLGWLALMLELQPSSKSRSLFLSGIIVGLAILAHQLNVLLVVMGLFFVLADSCHRDATRRMLSFLASTSLVVALGYFVAGLLKTSSISLHAILYLAAGYFRQGDPAWGNYLAMEYLPVAWSHTIGAIVHFGGRSLPSVLSRGVLLFVLGFIMLLGAVKSRSMGYYRKVILVAAFLQYSILLVLIFWWDPFNIKYWLLPLIPLAIALACVSEAVQGSVYTFLRSRVPYSWMLSRSLLPLLAVLIILFNLTIPSPISGPPVRKHPLIAIYAHRKAKNKIASGFREANSYSCCTAGGQRLHFSGLIQKY